MLRRRFVPFIDRLAAWAKDIREQANGLPPGPSATNYSIKLGRPTLLPV
jgi:hypothetical protein